MKMATKNETRYMELNVPQEAMTEVAEIIEENELDATILGTGEDEETICVGFDYDSKQRENIMEILELIEDYTSDEDNEEENEEEHEEQETED